MRLDTETRRKQIIETSLEIIKKGGIQSLTLKEISKHIGISEQALYRHYDNKLSILTSIIHFFNEKLSVFLDDIKSTSAIEQIKNLTKAHLEFIEQNPATAAVIFSEEIFQNESSLVREVHDSLNKRIDHMTKIIRKGQKNGEIKKEYTPKYLAYMFLGSLRLLVTNWRLSSFSFNLRNQGRLLVNNLTNLIRKG